MMFKVYILNPSFSFYWVWKMVKIILSEEIKENIFVLKKSQIGIMYEHGIPEDQLCS